jgi:acetolactate synthase regulatory subunit
MREAEQIMKHTLNIQLRAGEGTVLRTLGMIERRGFSLESCTIGEEVGSEGRPMLITVSSERPVALLKRQLERLHVVLWVDVEARGKGEQNRRWAGNARMTT